MNVIDDVFAQLQSRRNDYAVFEWLLARVHAALGASDEFVIGPLLSIGERPNAKIGIRTRPFFGVLRRCKPGSSSNRQTKLVC